MHTHRARAAPPRPLVDHAPQAITFPFFRVQVSLCVRACRAKRWFLVCGVFAWAQAGRDALGGRALASAAERPNLTRVNCVAAACGDQSG